MIQLETAQQRNVFESLAPDLTPMLDILFILIVFFMLTAGTVFQSLDVTLPEGVKEALQPTPTEQQLVLEIQQNAYILDGKKFSDTETIKQALKVKSDSKNLVIAAGKDITAERLLKMLTFLQAQNIQTANILMTEETP